MGPFRRRSRGVSLSTVPPSIDTSEYSPELARLAASILYLSPLPSKEDLPVYILNSAAFPDSNETSYDRLLPYVLARLPSDEQMIGSRGYEVVFFAGGDERGSDNNKKARPGWSWFLQVYQILSRAMRKKLQKLYLVHERRWIRVTFEMFSTVVSPKFRRKVVHASTLSALALHIPIEDLLVPPSTYDRDRKVATEIYVPYASGRRAFGVVNPLPTSASGDLRLPRVLRETSKFLLMPSNVRTEGVFRVNSRALTTEVLKEAYDRGQKFILWRDPPAVLAPAHFKEGFGDVTIQELDPQDGYSVHNAAGLIKTWYSSLREPIFPQASYAFLSRVYGGTEPQKLEISVFLDLVLQSADFSPLTRSSRRILTMHLFPLLSRIAAHAGENKMSPKNLATCFAPGLLCGPDPVEDAKMSAIISRIIDFGIENWNKGISEKCHMDGTVFEDMLLNPKNPTDAEDALDSSSQERRNTDRPEQQQGILMLDDDSDSDSGNEELTQREPQRNTDTNQEQAPPPLPPRVAAWTGGSQDHTGPLVQSHLAQTPTELSPTNTGLIDIHGGVRRKPAPPVQQPPRYSMIVGPGSNSGVPENLIDAHVADGFRTEPMSAIEGSHVADGFQSQGFGQGSRLPGYSEFEDEIPYTESPGVSRASTTASIFSRRPERSSIRKPPLQTNPEETTPTPPQVGQNTFPTPKNPKSQDITPLNTQLASTHMTTSPAPILSSTAPRTSTSPALKTISPLDPQRANKSGNTSQKVSPASSSSSGFPRSAAGMRPRSATRDEGDLMEFSPTKLSPANTGLTASSRGSVVRKPVGGGEAAGEEKRK